MNNRNQLDVSGENKMAKQIVFIAVLVVASLILIYQNAPTF
jgi:hypothetical protein